MLQNGGRVMYKMYNTRKITGLLRLEQAGAKAGADGRMQRGFYSGSDVRLEGANSSESGRLPRWVGD